MKYRRMPIEEESPEQLGYDKIRYNLTESSVRDRSLSDLAIEFAPVQQIAARGDVPVAKLLEFLAQRCDRRLRRVAVLPVNRLVVALRHTFILTRNGLQ